MSVRTRVLFSAIAMTSILAACSDVAATGPDVSAPSFAKSGTAVGGSSATGSTTTTTSTSSSPMAPSYSARITSIGLVPTGLYYGTPSQWTVGGFVFEGNYFTHLKPVAGPLVVGACVAVTFSEANGIRYASELKTVDASKCG